MLLGCFLGFATICSLLATPWSAPKHLTVVKDTYVLLIAGLIQVPVLFFGQLTVGPCLSALLVVFWAIRNRHLTGSSWLALGVLGNALAMMAHGGAMPLDSEVARQLGLSPTAQLLPGSKDVIGNQSLWGWLGDWLMVRTQVYTLVLSPGDLCIIAALARWCVACHIEQVPAQAEARIWINPFKTRITT